MAGPTVDRQGTLTGGWSKSALLRVGGSAFGGIGALSMQVDFAGRGRDLLRDPVGFGPAAAYTISFDVNTDALFGTNFLHVRPVATVNWSTEGNGVRRRFDVVNGMSLTGVMDHLSVVVEDRTSDFVTVPPGSTLDYLLSVLVTPGTRASRHVPPILLSSGPVIIAGGAPAVDVPIPADAGVTAVEVFAFALGGGLLFVQQLDATGNILAAWTPTGAEPQWVPVLPTANRIRLTNAGGMGSLSQYEVVFGIDG